MRSLRGLGQMLKLAAYQESRWVGWTALIFVGTYLATATQMASLAPTLQDRVGLKTSLSATPAMTFLLGSFEHPETVASSVSWRIGLFMAAALSVLAALTVVRHTRAEEEAGRLELLAAGQLGRAAGLAAALIAALTLVLVVAMASSVTLIGHGANPSQSIGHGVALAVPALVSLSVAAVAAQLTATARAAKSIVITFVLVAYVLRGVSDLRGQSAIGALNPFGWYEAVDPFGELHLWPLWLSIAVATVLTLSACLVAFRRDLGAGLFAIGAGRPNSRHLIGPITLVARLGWRSLLGWAVVIAVTGVFVGSLIPDLGDFAETTPEFTQILQSLGGAGMIQDSFVSVMAEVFGVAAACWAVSQVGTWRAEESTGRLEAVLATRVSRSQMLLALAGFIFTGVLIMQLSAGLATGLSAGELPDSLLAQLVRVPPAWLLAAFALLMVAWRPAWFALAWLLILVSVIFGIYGDLLGIPRSLRGISVFQHVPNVPVESISWAPLIAMGAISVGLVLLSLVLLERRDVPTVVGAGILRSPVQALRAMRRKNNEGASSAS